MSFVKTDAKGYVIDPTTKAIISTDDEYKKYLDQKKARKEQKTVQDQINSLKGELDLVKKQLAELISKNG